MSAVLAVTGVVAASGFVAVPSEAKRPATPAYLIGKFRLEVGAGAQDFPTRLELRKNGTAVFTLPPTCKKQTGRFTTSTEQTESGLLTSINITALKPKCNDERFPLIVDYLKQGVYPDTTPNSPFAARGSIRFVYDTGTNGAPLAGRQWTIVAVDSKETPALADKQIEFGEVRFSRSDGCNGTEWQYITRPDGRISIQAGFQTLKYCAPESIDPTMARIAEVLRGAQHFEVLSGTTLRIVDGRGTMTLAAAQ